MRHHDIFAYLLLVEGEAASCEKQVLDDGGYEGITLARSESVMLRATTGLHHVRFL